MTTLGIRNLNPGNIIDGQFAQGRPGYLGVNGRFAVFNSMGHGIAALIALLRIYRKQHKLTTVRGIINRWAPPVENNTSAYVDAVCDGWVRPDEELPDTPETYLFLAQRIARHECAPDHVQITPEDWEQGLALAGLSVPVAPAPEASPPAPEPPKEKTMAAPFAMLALKTLLTSIPTLIRFFGKGERSEENAKLADAVVPLAKQALGASNEQEVIERVMNEPGAIQTIDTVMQANLPTLIEAGGGGIAGAAQRDMAFVTALKGEPWWGFLRSPSFWALVLLLPLVYLIVLSISGVLGPVQWSDDVRASIAGLIVGTVVGGAVGYYWGQSTSRNRTPATYGGSKGLRPVCSMKATRARRIHAARAFIPK